MHTELLQVEQDEWLSFIPHIIHELRTPLSILQMESQLIEKWVPELLKGYRLAVEKGLMEGKLNESQLELHEKTDSALSKNLDKLAYFLDVFSEGVHALKSKPRDCRVGLRPPRNDSTPVIARKVRST
jgi:signal transduction histidine kinase